MLRIADSANTANKIPLKTGSRENRTVRLLHLALLLVSNPAQVQVSAFAGRHGVGRRTLYRDLQVLRRAGFCVTYDSRVGHYRLEPSEVVRDLVARSITSQIASMGSSTRSDQVAEWPLCWEESVALIAALRSASVPPGTEWRQRLQSAAGSIEEWVARRFDTEAENISAHATQLLSRSDLSLRQLYQAIEKSLPERSSA